MPLVQNRNFRPRTDLSILIDAIRAEGRESLAEERREDQGKQLREWITIGVITATLIAIVAQVREMRRAYDPIELQAKASVDAAKATKEAADVAVKQVKDSESDLELAQRAWVGPNDASLSTQPQAGKPVDVSISYQNTGHEPAVNFGYSIDTFVAESGKLTQAQGSRLEGDEQVCKAENASTGGSVIYPSTGFNSLAVTDPEPVGVVNALLSNPHNILVIEGCFWYRTFKAQKHSYYCYFYNSNQSNLAHLSICSTGADAN